jgi:hypothetical protein
VSVVSGVYVYVYMYVCIRVCVCHRIMHAVCIGVTMIEMAWDVRVL